MEWTVEKYARAMWDMGMPLGSLEKACEIYGSEPKLKDILEDPTVYREEKERVIQRVFPEETWNLLKMLCVYLDIKKFPEIVENYRAYMNRKTRVVNGKLKFVTSPDESQLLGIKDFLKREFDADDTDLVLERDEALMGGFVLEAEGRTFDWSLKGRYELLRNKIM